MRALGAVVLVLGVVGCGHDAERKATPGGGEAGVVGATRREAGVGRLGLVEAGGMVAAGRKADGAADGGARSDTAPKKEVPVAKSYKTVVHMGDSMVGGGLCKALAPKFKTEGTKFVRDVWESASIPMFDDSDRIPTLMKRWDPDLVLVTLGANDVFNEHPEYMIKHIESIVKKIGHRDCVWIGPPLWKGDKGLTEVIENHAAPCRFYDSQHLTLQRAGDGIHPTEKGGQVWADAFWPWFKGTEVDAGATE